MPYNGAGLFTRIYQWVNDEVLGLNVDATRTDTDSNDIAVGLSNCVTRDGQSPWLANLPAGNFKITGLGVGAVATDSVNYGQVFNSPAFITPTATTSPSAMDNSLRLATTSYVVQTILAISLPSQTTGFLISDGASASFSQTHTGYAQKEVRGADIASAATINLTTATGNYVHITGSVNITGITIPVGAEYTLIFDGAPLITHSAGLACPNAQNIQTVATGRMKVRGDTAGAVVVLYNEGNATSAEVRTGTAANKPVTPATLLSAAGMSAFFQTADQVITDAATFTVAHGIGRIPVMLLGFLRCTTAEFGYSIGDVVPVSLGVCSSVAASKGVSVVADITNIVVRYSDGGGSSGPFLLVNKTTGGTSIATNANWRFFVRAFG